MATAKAALVAAIQAAANALGDEVKITLGTPGSKVQGSDPRLGAQDTGQAWEANQFLDLLATYIGAQLDTRGAVHGEVTTGATTVAPALVAGSSGVSSVTKDEGAETITINFSTSWTTNTYGIFAVITGTGAGAHVFEVISSSVSAVTLRFHGTVTGNPIGINSRTVRFMFVGPQ